MFRQSYRFFTAGSVIRQAIPSPASSAIPSKITPILAAKQFIPNPATKSKKKSLKKKEKRLKRQIIRDVNNLKKHNIDNVKFSVDPVLGNSNCGFTQRLRKELQEPTNLAYGYEREEFEKLLYGAQKASLDTNIAGDSVSESIRATEEKKKAALLTILNMKNTHAQDKRKLAIKYAREEFQREEGDTGSPEVQAAVLTAKIHIGWDHVKLSFKDKIHTAHIRQLVQQRQKILKYLKRDNPEKYFYTLAKLGLADDVITREFSMSKQYFQDYKVYGDKQLVRISDKQKEKEAKILELQRRVVDYNETAKKNYELLQSLT